MRSILTAALSAMLCSSAFAADPIIFQDLTPDPIAPVLSAPTTYDWSGFYLGADLGHDWINVKTKPDAAAAGAGIHQNDSSTDAWMGGLYGGYNYEMGDWVLGGEGDVQFLYIGKDKGEKKTGPNALEKKVFGTARLRAGYAMDRFLPYLTGGVAVGQFSLKPDGGKEDKNTHIGYTVGAGVDYALTDNLIGKLEYQFTDFGDKTYNLNTGSAKIGFREQTVRIGLAYKF